MPSFEVVTSKPSAVCFQPTRPFNSSSCRSADVAAEPRRDLRELHVGGDFRRFAVGEPRPHAQGADAAREIDRKIDPRPPRRDVGVVELHEDLAVPLRQRLDRAPGEVAAHVERRGQFFRRHRAQAEAVVRTGVLEPEIDAGQRQRRRAAHGVVPADGGAANGDFALPQQPVGEPAAVDVLGQFDAGDGNDAALVAPDVEIGPFDADRIEARLPARQRPPRQHAADAIELERRRAGLVEHGDVVQRQLQVDADPAPLELADGDALAGGRRQVLRDQSAVLFDIGQKPETGPADHQRENETADQQRPARHAVNPQRTDTQPLEN